MTGSDALFAALLAYNKAFGPPITQADTRPLLMRLFDGAGRLSEIAADHPRRAEAAAIIQRAVDAGERLEVSDATR